jgi:hypothetical protein
MVGGGSGSAGGVDGLKTLPRSHDDATFSSAGSFQGLQSKKYAPSSPFQNVVEGHFEERGTQVERDDAVEEWKSDSLEDIN